MTDELKSLYVDMPSWSPGISSDDFVVAVGKTKSNSVYHVFEVKIKPRRKTRIVRYYLQVFKSDLITALRRGKDQKLFTVTWYNRDKKKR